MQDPLPTLSAMPKPGPRDAEVLHIGRQPIVDAAGNAQAYELLYREGSGNWAHVLDDTAATAHVIARTLGGIGLERALRKQAGFVNLGRQLLLDDLLLLVPPGDFVLEVLESVPMDTSVLHRLAWLREAGYRIALDDVVALTADVLKALSAVDFVKVDFRLAHRADLPRVADAVLRADRLLIAEKIESADDLALAQRLGCHLFQGFHFARPEPLTAPLPHLDRGALARLHALLTHSAHADAVLAELHANPGLVAQLLRLAVATGVQPGGGFASVRALLVALGADSLLRWVRLLQMSDGLRLPAEPSLRSQAACRRAGFMEQAARHVRPQDTAFAEAAYLTGVLSLAPLPPDGTRRDIQDSFPVTRTIRHAVLHGHGELGALLHAAEVFERGGNSLAMLATPGMPAA
ncbi:EAL domain-containing protein [Cupriavidus sp. WKF15]|uniref:EAL and HDOD domain-containing protein n=1 Tax=Cupriavidus sp. WKF15 TaxID=3032282 RepID=UPI0023E30588|nr:EAL domain-containing protein [Cupriavidus sp. WKF15]WER48508.1 EAL domain-containing protein [Cupriavidus sp. WKF15]